MMVSSFVAVANSSFRARIWHLVPTFVTYAQYHGNTKNGS
jgi:hypothetical protein